MTGHLYKTYLFKDKDPIIDTLRTIIKDHHIKTVAENSGVKETTIYAWLYGMTKRPQYATLNAVFNALGYSLTPKQHTAPQSVTLRIVPKVEK